MADAVDIFKAGELFKIKIEGAKRKKMGIWSSGEHDVVDPAKFKREMKAKNRK